MLKRLAIVLFCGFSSVLSAAELQVGQAFPTLQLQDQHNKTITIQANAQTILFTAEKPASELLNQYLKAQPANFMPQQQAYFIADISKMPSMITKLFALPKMREQPWSTLLVYNQQKTASIPRKANHVTCMKLHNTQIQSIQFIQDSGKLAECF